MGLGALVAVSVCKGALVASLTQHGERSSEFGRFWWGEAVSGLGSAVTSLALQTLVLVTLQGDAVQVGWLNSARWLPYLVLGLVVEHSSTVSVDGRSWWSPTSPAPACSD